MYYFSATILICLFILSILKYKKILHPLCIFNVIWFIVVFFSGLRIGGMLLPSDSIYLMCTVGALFFNFGAILYDRKRNRVKRLTHVVVIERRFLINACIFVVLVFNSILLFRGLKYIADNPLTGFGLIRYEYYYGNTIITNVVEALINGYIIEGLRLFLIIYLVSNIFSEKINYKRIILISITIIFESIFSGGRTAIISIVLLLIVMLIYKFKNLKRKNKRIIFWISICFVIVFISISFQRNISNIIEQGIIYFVGPLSFVSVLHEHTDYSFLYFGRIFFASILDIFINMFRLFNLTNWETAALFVSDITRENQLIGESLSFNALVPYFWNFYLEAGYIGVIIYSCAYGFIASLIYKKFKNNIDNNKFVMLYLIMILSIFFSMRSWFFMPVNTLIALLIIINTSTKNCR